jgi:hypothetical protein
MGLLTIDDLKPGMVLGGDVKDRNGRNLLSAGTELTEKHLRIFKIWGVLEVDVKGVEQEEVAAQAAAAINPEDLLRAETIVADLFRHTDPEDPVMRELRRSTTIRLARSKKEAADGN